MQLLAESGQNAVKLEEDSSSNQSLISQEMRELSQLTTPKTLDTADLFVLLSDKSKVDPEQAEQIEAELLKALNYQRDGEVFDEQFYENCEISYESFMISDGRFADSLIAKTRITPPNHNPNLPPIVFIGGLIHKTPVYLKQMIKMAQVNGQEVICIDSPGNGASLQDARSNGPQRLWKTVEQALAADASLQDGFILMGHSLGSAVADYLRQRSELPILHTASICPIGNMPVDVFRGQSLSLPIVGSSLAAMIGHSGKITAKMKDIENGYKKDRPEEEQQELFDHISNEVWNEDLINFTATWLGKPSVWKQTQRDQNGRKVFADNYSVILAENDTITSNKKIEAWKKRGAHVIAGAEHSFIAGFDADRMQRYAEEIMATIPRYEMIDGEFQKSPDHEMPINVAYDEG
ncbi:MAG: alpha/beta fold hydrolase [Deltaproteobacteria bacterium]|nr:alpha/beta fold hydrolase [Deltaproteobacteria bacterium]